jgi:hypothetical protein
VASSRPPTEHNIPGSNPARVYDFQVFIYIAVLLSKLNMLIILCTWEKINALKSFKKFLYLKSSLPQYAQQQMQMNL